MLATSDPDAGSLKRKGGQGLAGTGQRQPFRFLLRPCRTAKCAGAKPLHGKGKIGQPVMPGQRFAQDTQAAHVDARRLVGRIDRCQSLSQPASPSALTRALQVSSTLE
jgi:hypothetical protein